MVSNIGLEVIKRQREKEILEEKKRKDLAKKKKEIENIIRNTEKQNFIGVYIMISIDYVINEFIGTSQLGYIEYEYKKSPTEKIIVNIINQNLDVTKIRDRIELAAKEYGIFNLARAIQFLDSFDIETHEEGGVKIVISKEFNKYLIRE